LTIFYFSVFYFKNMHSSDKIIQCKNIERVYKKCQSILIIKYYWFKIHSWSSQKLFMGLQKYTWWLKKLLKDSEKSSHVQKNHEVSKNFFMYSKNARNIKKMSNESKIPYIFPFLFMFFL
jgi:hypothetical protein